MIEIQGLTKKFKNVTAVNDLSLTVNKQDIYGFIGPNGAGKTTTIRMLVTLLRPTAGTARIDGLDIRTSVVNVRRIIGYMPDNFGIYRDMSVWDYMMFFAAAYEVPPSQREKRVQELLKLTGLGDKHTDEAFSLSRGVRQRLCLAKTLIHDPSVLILDEPAAGLDPRARIEFRDLLKEMQQRGKTSFISSHILSELKELCNRVAIIEKGNLILEGDVAEITSRLNPQPVLLIEVEGEPEVAANMLRTGGIVNEVAVAGNTLKVTFDGADETAAAIVKKLVSENITIGAVKQEEPDLEDIFMSVTKGEVS